MKKEKQRKRVKIGEDIFIPNINQIGFVINTNPIIIKGVFNGVIDTYVLKKNEKFEVVKDIKESKPRIFSKKVINKIRNNKKGDYFSSHKPLKDKKINLVKEKIKAPFISKGKTAFKLQKVSGVYIIYIGKQIVYVGFSAKDVYKALYRHFYPYRDKIPQERKVFNADEVKVRVIYTKNGKQADRLEKALIIKYKPQFNTLQYSNNFVMDDKEKEILKEFIKTESSDIIFNDIKDLPF